MITTNENYKLDEILPQLACIYSTGDVVDKVTCREKEVLPEQTDIK